MGERLQKFISDRAALLDQVGIDNPKSEIELILCHLLKTDRLHLYLDGASLLTDTIKTQVDEIVKQRQTRYPLQFILNVGWFYGREFYVTPDVMAPTPETERLCETALGFCEVMKYDSPRILDLGVGSGVISVTMALELDECDIVAVDVSPEALAVAEKNAHDLGAIGKITFRQSDFFSAIKEGEQFDLILSNPPYITEGDYVDLEPEVLADPKIAMTSGEDGLDAIREILDQAPNYLAPGGRIMFEIGWDQSEVVAELTGNDARYDFLNIIKDLNDIDRVIILGCKTD